MDILENLNEEQYAAVTTTEGFVRVVAGAGSGKTRALSHRFAYLVTELGIMPSDILCVTFTNKSAGEMRQRIHNLTGDNDTGLINTFHGFCVTILSEEAHAIGYPESFLVLDNSDIDSMLEIIYADRGLTLRDMTFSHARDMIEMFKLRKYPDYFLSLVNLSRDELKKKYDEACTPAEIIFFGYLYEEKKCFGLDYNDLILLTLHIFDENPEIKFKWQKRLEYIMIDEFQDIDEPQYRLMKVLCDYHKNLFVVGDPDQTIYTWRGADGRYFLDFDKEYPTAKTVVMNKNYRSTPEILAAANSLIAKNPHRYKKDLIPTLPSGDTVVCHHGEDAKRESEWIAEKIAELNSSGVPLRDITVLFRAHYVTKYAEEVFIEKKIPYRIYNGVQFYDRAEIKDALSYLRMAVYKDDLSFMRIVNVPRRNIGKGRMERLREYADENGVSLYTALCNCRDEELFRTTKADEFIDLIENASKNYAGRSVTEVLTDILGDSGYEKMLRTKGSSERLDNLAQLKQSIFDYERTCGEECTVEKYLKSVALFTDADASDGGDKVKMMTVHAAKGLEFPYVFLVGMNEGIFPTGKTKTARAMEEERRLCFVAMTRAEKGLYLTEAEGRNFDGSPRFPSRFILDIDKDLLKYTKEPSAVLIENARRYIAGSERMMSEDENRVQYDIGTRVRHRVFGDGTVTGHDPDGGSNIIQFDSMETPRKISSGVKMEIL